jgi:hypothetical protein
MGGRDEVATLEGRVLTASLLECGLGAGLVVENECDHVATNCMGMNLIHAPSWRGSPRAHDELARFTARPGDEVGSAVVAINGKICDSTESRVCSLTDDEAFHAKNPNARGLRFVDQVACCRRIDINFPSPSLGEIRIPVSKVFNQAHGHSMMSVDLGTAAAGDGRSENDLRKPG